MATTTQLKRSSLLHITLWIVQVLLAAMFLAVGLMKTATPIEELAQTMPLAGDMPILTRFIGVVEILGGLGLILPAALRIIPKITAWAAAGLALIMIFALIFHLSRGEMSAIGTNMVLGTLAGFVAWGRATKAQILARAQ
ncbi:MAG TPA: DoxX family protein [Chryseosolibacter sp.]|nr:DoxX family protein [Chryseosolibacter sp.]